MEKLDEVVNTIKNSKEYKTVIELKEKMNSNEDINSLVKKIKILQKKYIRTNDKNIKLEITDGINTVVVFGNTVEKSINSPISFDKIKEQINKLGT